jgi:hypothetical protein
VDNTLTAIFYAFAVPVSLGWVGWVSLSLVRNSGVRDRLSRIEDKLDRLIERFL